MWLLLFFLLSGAMELFVQILFKGWSLFSFSAVEHQPPTPLENGKIIGFDGYYKT